ncbi:MAG TPA: response regulator transcription factor [Cytophagaceae bacterium]|nr:response regulator transcription factor [Cytophagaceae bacterium]
MSEIKIIIADDHALIRNGIKTMLSRNADYKIVAEAENGKELVELASKLIPDVVLADISMPVLNGFDALAELRKLLPDTKVILLTMHEEPEYIIKAARSGANGYLLKNVDYEELHRAIGLVMSGQKYFNQQVSSILMEELHRKSDTDQLQEKLTERESDILKEIVKGLSSKEIADKLFISSRTVDTHRNNLMKKLSVHNTAELVKLALEKGLV